MIIKSDQIDSFTTHINSQHPAIKFTIEKEVDSKIPVLDVLIVRDDTGQLSFQVYRKPTHTEQYLSFSSHHPLQHKLGVIRTLSDRATTIVSKEEDKQQELARVRRSLAICGCKDWAWDTVTRNKACKDHPDHPGTMFKDPKAMWVSRMWRVSLSRYRNCSDHME